MTPLRPRVGDIPTDGVDGSDRVPWLLGTHLHPEVGPLARAPEGSRVLMVEAHGFARRKPYHHQKLTLVFAAMRQFRDALRQRGYDVAYIQAETFREGLATYAADHPEDTLVVMRSPSHRAGPRLRDIGEEAGVEVDVVENELFVSTRAAFDEWANGREAPFRHEEFYRWMRRETGVLVEGGDPVGGEWNFDDQNRDFPPDDWDPPAVFEPDHGALPREVAAWVSEEFDTWGRPAFAPPSGEDSADAAGFVWPTTREGALARLDHFVTDRLPDFGPYQYAMRADDWAMAHSLLSPSLNLGLLHPWEVVTVLEDAAREGTIPTNSAEGAIRQVLGWREFMRHVYRHAMPDLGTASQLGADRELPGFFWTGETGMACVGGSVGDVRERGYAHHIQRLMVLANFATLWGVDPADLNDWFHATYVDAYHWVTTPNVVEMGSYGAGVFATKPYVAAANYIDRMSDYCEGCAYDEDRATGAGACPFTALYWDFLDRNEDDLRSNHRMSFVYGHVDDKRESGAMDEIRERVSELRTLARDGEL